MTLQTEFASEKAIGLVCYVTPQPGIGGRIKQLVDDFIVKEIIPDGKILPIEAAKEIEQGNPPSGKYTVFILQKRDWDTHRLIQQLSQRLRVSRKRFSFAGTKDRRALTIQRMSVWNVPPERLLEINIKDVKILNPVYANRQVQLGDLWGNNFTIIVRDISESEVKIERNIQQFLEVVRIIEGLPNFFGHQRFGSLRPITHLVGKSLIQGDFKKAAAIFLKTTSPLESSDVTLTRIELAETENYKNAVKRFPKGYQPELAMINHLLKHPNDFINAFRKISKGLRLMFVHAFQSYIFNKFLSLRLKKGLPLKPIEGDIVQNADGSVHLFKDNYHDAKSTLVAPLIGYNLPLFPTGIVGELLDDVLSEEEIEPSMFHIKAYPEASSKGEYRAITMPVIDFQVLEINDDPLNKGRKQLSVTFSLVKGSYATILLRELMKTDLVTPMYEHSKG